MIRTFITGLLKGYDDSLTESRATVEYLRTNMGVFNEVAYKDVSDLVEQIKSCDPRISTEERNKGFYVNFNGFRLFRIAVNAFSERSEIVVDGHAVLKYQRRRPKEYDKKYKKSP